VGLVTLLTLVFLVAMWVAVLAAPVLQGRSSSSRGGDSIKNFQRQLAVLERSNPRAQVARGGQPRSAAPRHPGPARPVAARPAAPRAAARNRPVTQPVRVGTPAPAHRSTVSGGRVAAERRRRVVIILAAAVVTTAAVAWMVGGWFWGLNLLADALLVAYIAVAVRVVRSAAELEMKVAFLPHRESGAEPTALLRDSVRSSAR
jgi:hypothetical protein